MIHYELRYWINGTPYQGHFWSTGKTFEEKKISAIHIILKSNPGIRENEITRVEFEEIPST